MVMKYTLKHALIISCLMGSSAAMAAVNGDPINGGSGTVNISGTVSTTTCSAAIQNGNQSFVVQASRLTEASGTSLASPYSTITLTGCNGQELVPSITASNLYSADGWFAGFDDYIRNDAPIRYQVGFRGDNITGGATVGGVHYTLSNGMQPSGPNNQGLIIKVNSDTYSLDVVSDVRTTGKPEITGKSTAPKATYTYNLNYA